LCDDDVLTIERGGRRAVESKSKTQRFRDAPTEIRVVFAGEQAISGKVVGRLCSNQAVWFVHFILLINREVPSFDEQMPASWNESKLLFLEIRSSLDCLSHLARLSIPTTDIALSALPATGHNRRMNETIRLAGLDDAAAVTALTRSAYSKWVPVIGREPLPMRADHAAHIRDHRTDLLFVGENLAALVETIERDDDVLIENVAVDPNFQKRGYGRKMVAYAEQLARAAGLTVVRLYTHQRFEENLRLYASLGYEVEREEAVSGGILIHMAKAVG